MQMNWSPVAGIFLAILLIVVSVSLSIEDPTALLNPLGLIIVFVGTFAATMISFSFRDIRGMGKVIAAFFRNEVLYKHTDIEELAKVTTALRSASMQKIEASLATVNNPFLKFGLQLIVDGKNKDEIEDILNFQIEKLQRRENAEAAIFRAMAGFSPAFGMLGTLLGLINMLSNMTDDVTRIGSDLAVALMTTLYGLLAANILFRPIALRWEARTMERIASMRMIMEGVEMVQQQFMPGTIKDRFEKMGEDPVNGGKHSG